MSSSDKINVFQFMTLRAPEATDSPGSTRGYVWDTGELSRQTLEYLDENGDLAADYKVSRPRRQPFRPDSDSAVGRLVYEKVFQPGGEVSPKQINAAVVEGVLGQMVTLQPQLGTAPVGGRSIDIVHQLDNQVHIATASGDRFYLLPTRLIDAPAFDARDWLPRARDLLNRHARVFDKDALVAELNALFAGYQGVWSMVYLSEGHAYNNGFHFARASLWDTLYQLYILRRIVDIDLGEVMDGLRVLHAIELVAVDACLAAARAGTLPAFPGVDYYATLFEGIFQEHKGLRNDPLSPQAYTFIASADDLRACLEAQVVIPPIVAELGYYPIGKFNAITPYLGDLKVVKQWLRGYRVGEIAKVVNVMKGEERTRSSRLTERSVDTLTYTTDDRQSTTSERQATDKYDIKQEAETVLKAQLEANAKANTDIGYEMTGYKIQTSIGAGFAFTNASESTRKSANAFAREVMDKAVTAVERKTSQSRSVTSTRELVDIDRQKYINTGATAEHVSGIYRWLDKRYEAQLFNYGKRWMIEFVIPEPAAFLVESRLQAVAKDLRLPRPPTAPELAQVDIRHPYEDRVLTASDISPAVFNALAVSYDLSGFTYPAAQTPVDILKQDDGSNYYVKDTFPHETENAASAYSFRVRLPGATGKVLSELRLEGIVDFRGRRGSGEPDSRTGGRELFESEYNRMVITLGGARVWSQQDDDREGWRMTPQVIPINPGLVMAGEDSTLTLSFNDLEYYRLTITGVLTDPTTARFQADVFRKIQEVEQERVDAINAPRQLAFEAAKNEYLQALDTLRAQTVNDLLQGRSEAFNLGVIREELKRQCVSMISHEFDWDESDDLIRTLKPIRERQTGMAYPTFQAGDDNGKPYSKFESLEFDVEFPFMHLPDSRKKGRFTQFLEQAFEWQQVSYLFYPYFWGRRKKWIELMNRLDYADSTMTAFLRAGSARVLVAVTPGYYDAVMYYLSTREPWGGGPAPVIGDPLFIPIHEEIRKQQDDLAGAVPDGASWNFTVPTSLVYLQDSSSPIPEDLSDPEEPAEPGQPG
ncbi:hypothetical protein [Arenimonas sp. MALMAid1274]|uniref:hypothetical protein n=1 Tax=Arenimonas sp. MALMAid1274 TaxID=3411630 RepID=UPI003B9FAAD3